MKTISAIYENGVFRPKTPVTLPAGAQVEILLPGPDDDPAALLKARFPNSFGGLSEQAANEMTKAIEQECEQIDPDVWR